MERPPAEYQGRLLIIRAYQLEMLIADLAHSALLTLRGTDACVCDGGWSPTAVVGRRASLFICKENQDLLAL